MTDGMQTGPSGRLSDEELLAAVPRGTGGREARVGLFVLLGLISFVIVIFWMTDPATLRGRYMVVTTVDNAGGVRAGDPVQMQGVNIGRVNGFEMIPNGPIYITLEVEGEWRIPRGSRTEMGEAGLFGGRTLMVIRGPSDEFVSEWDTIPGEGAAAGLLGSVGELSAQAGSVLSSIDSLLSRETVGSVQQTVKDLDDLIVGLSAVTNEQRAALARLTESLTRSAQGLETATAAGPNVASAVARADSAMAMLAAASENLDAVSSSLRTVLARVEAGEGTLGRLSTDDALYQNLNDAASSLSSLLQDLQANPNRYINISIF
ncbi:MAG: MCE family protein [Gemmatimonadetes bacterium]|nr:MCE family protein [Gemmatimonadota bacterium]